MEWWAHVELVSYIKEHGVVFPWASVTVHQLHLGQIHTVVLRLERVLVLQKTLTTIRFLKGRQKKKGWEGVPQLDPSTVLVWEYGYRWSSPLQIYFPGWSDTYAFGDGPFSCSPACTSSLQSLAMLFQAWFLGICLLSHRETREGESCHRT